MIVLVLLGAGIFALLVAFAFARQVLAIAPTEGAANPQEASRMQQIADAIREGSRAFLRREYQILILFMIIFAIIIVLVIDDPTTTVRDGLYTAISFLVGAATSIASGYIGMWIATQGNVRTAAAARQSLARAFTIAFHSGAVMGFALTGLAVVGLVFMYLVLSGILPPIEEHYLMEILSGYGLGGSSVALFARVGGGIYTKAADVGADLVGKVEAGIPEDDPRNPAVIADNVGDNVGDTAGMGADLFGSIAESTCAALVIGGTAFAFAPEDIRMSALLFPIFVSALGIVASFVSLFVARVKKETDVEKALKRTLVVASVLVLVLAYPFVQTMLPEHFQLSPDGPLYSRMGVYVSIAAGVISGLLIGLLTEFFTSNRYKPVKSVAESARTGSATNIIYGLALGYNSAVIPMLLMAITVVLAYSLAGMYGIAMAAIGMLSFLAIELAIDAYGPVADNAGGIAEMAGMGKEVRHRTDVLDAAGNTTAAIGKGFAIGSAAFTSLALTSAFLTRAHLLHIDMLKPIVLAGLMVGAALPYAFSAMTMRSVGKAAFDMIEEVRRQFREIKGLLEGKAKPDYARCVDIATRASLREMIAPGLLVIGTPLVIGFLFGVEMLAGVLIGALISGVMMAVSMANSGAAWDNAKKYVEKGELGGKGSDVHKATVVGDTVGDPFKDTSGPSLNILIKLMAIISLVFVPFFKEMGGILLK